MTMRKTLIAVIASIAIPAAVAPTAASAQDTATVEADDQSQSAATAEAAGNRAGAAPQAATTIVVPDWFPKINGTIRSNYEVNTDDGASHFRVRNARISFTGTIVPEFEYKAEVDLCDEGKIKMLDAYVRYLPASLPVTATIGQMRVPFTIDAHRAPHQQYFANRSFIAKYGGNVRDVGLAGQYTLKGEVPLTVQAGVFNGSGLTNQKDYWTKTFNFSVKTMATIAGVLTLEASCQKSRPEDISIMMWNGGAAFDDGLWHIEAEYLRKNYMHAAFDGVNIVNTFISRKFPLRSNVSSIAALGRYDYMDDHSDGIKNDMGELSVTTPQRHRMTLGTTLSFGTTRYIEVRVNYEKYFYQKDAVIPISGHDKMVVEAMCRF